MSGPPQTVIVTGGAYGIGRGICRLFAARGWRVVIADIDEQRGRALEAELAGSLFVHADLRDAAAIDRLFEVTLAQTGRLDALVNNAGIEKFAAPDQFALEDWDNMMGVNLRAAFLCARAAFPHLKATGGAVVNIASVQAFANEPGVSIYAGTKAGMLGLTRSMALDFAPHGVRINAVCPGAIFTGMTEAFLASQPDPQATLRKINHEVPMGRIGRPEDIAPAVYFLASPEAGYITGASLVVDGGLVSKISA